MLRGRITSGATSDYPDPLGYLTGGSRTTFDVLQCAIGTSPSEVALGQPFEILLVAEQLSDQPLRFTATLKPPYRHLSGARASFTSPQLTLEAQIAPGECVILRFPVVAQPPTPVGEGYVFTIQIQFNNTRFGRITRDPLGGRAPTVFAQSPLRMQILRDNVIFSTPSAGQPTEPNTLQTVVAVVPGEVHDPRDLAARIDSIWGPTLIGPDRVQLADLMARTTALASQLTLDRIYEPLRALAADRFQVTSVTPLPGETDAIAKLMAYTVAISGTGEPGEAPTLGQPQLLWFRYLTYFAHLTQLDDPTWLLDRLFAPILYDSVRVGYQLLSATLRTEAATNSAEADRQASLIVDSWTARKMTIVSLYLPLIMAGITLLARVRSPNEKVWRTLNALREAWQARAPGTTAEREIGAHMAHLLTTAEQDLIAMRIVPN